MLENKLTTKTEKINENLKENSLLVVDEITKVHPEVVRSVSNLQRDTIETSKNMIKTTFDTQEHIASSLKVSVPSQVSEQIVKQSNEITNSFVRAVEIYNQLSLNALNAVRETVKIYSKTADAVTEYNINILNAWTSSWATQRQHFIRG